MPVQHINLSSEFFNIGTNVNCVKYGNLEALVYTPKGTAEDVELNDGLSIASAVESNRNDGVHSLEISFRGWNKEYRVPFDVDRWVEYKESSENGANTPYNPLKLFMNGSVY